MSVLFDQSRSIERDSSNILQHTKIRSSLVN